MGQVIKSIFWGALAGIALLGLYFLVMGLGSGSWDYTIRELLRLKFWVAPLILGFGIQVGLFSYLRSCGAAMATGAGTSSLAMLACCAHHITDVLPVIGLSAATIFLVQYQEWFLGLGILSNLTGIYLMWRKIKA